MNDAYVIVEIVPESERRRRGSERAVITEA